MHERPYQKLIVWKEGHVLCLLVYKITTKFPSEEKFALTNQMRRSAYSVPTNIAEGNSRKTTKDRIHFIDIATCSLEELHYQCILSLDLHYIDQAEFEDLDERIRKVGYLLYKFRASQP